jgi:hypothetical protein
MKLRDHVDIANASDVATFNALLLRFAHHHDFGIISGLLVVEATGGQVDTVAWGNTPPAFASTFSDTEIGKRDPVLRRLKRLGTPFTYDQSTYVNEHAANLWETQAPFGYKTGIAMAAHLPHGMHFVMGVERAEPLPNDERVLVRLMADLRLLAAYAQVGAVRLLAPLAKSRGLNPLE